MYVCLSVAGQQRFLWSQFFFGSDKIESLNMVMGPDTKNNHAGKRQQ
jgi:hypothetical protein